MPTEDPSEGTDGMSSSSGPGRTEFDPEMDLLNRYERMIGIQIDTINGIDDKAAYTGRLIAILGGLILTAASIGVSSEAVIISRSTMGAFILLGIGSTALFISLVFSIITYLSSRFLYGPTAEIGQYMANYKVNSQQYRDVLLRGYSSGISSNKRVVEENSKRFKICLASLLVALLFLFGAGILLALPTTLGMDIILIIALIVIAFYLAKYIVREEYLTLDNLGNDNE